MCKLKEQQEIAKESKANPKEIWNYINGKVKCRQDIGDLKIITDQGEFRIYCNDIEKADLFCKYFTSVFNRENDDEFEVLLCIETGKMEEITLDVDDVLARLHKIHINKSAGVDEIHPRTLFTLRSVFALPVIFENSVSQPLSIDVSEET